MKPATKIWIALVNVLIFLSAIEIYKNQMSYYELSIYDSIFFPLAGLILGITISLGIVIVSMRGGCRYGTFLGVLEIGLCSLVVILVPLIKGYAYASMADNAWHIGYILDILNFGYIPPNNVYPVVHLFGATVTQITNFPLPFTAYILPPCYFFIYAASIAILCNVVFSRNVAVIASICGMVPVCFYYSQIMAMGVAFMALPLVIFLLLKVFHYRTLEWRATLLIYISVLPFWHPLAFLMAIFIIALFIMTLGIRNFISRIDTTTPSIDSNVSEFLVYFVFLLSTIFFYWSFQNIILSRFLDTVGSLLTESTVVTSPLNEGLTAFGKLGLGSMDIVFLFVKLYGVLTIFALFSAIGFVYILNQLRLHGSIKYALQEKYLVSLSFIYAVTLLCGTIAAVDFVKPLTGLASQRFLFAVYALIPVTTAFGLSLLHPDSQTQIKGMKTASVKRFGKVNVLKSTSFAFILAICLSIAIFTLFTSPIIYRPNAGATLKEVTGGGWMMYKGNNIYTILWDGQSVSQPDQYPYLLFGVTSDLKYPKIEPNLNVDEFAHFRYDRYQTLGASISANKYLLIREGVSILIYEKLYPLLARFTQLDFLKLSNDDSAHLLYSNGETEVYLISAS